METKDRQPNQSARKSYKSLAQENVIETLVNVPFNDDDEHLFPGEVDDIDIYGE